MALSSPSSLLSLQSEALIEVAVKLAAKKMPLLIQIYYLVI